MYGPVAAYSFINAKLRARISKILPEDTFQALARTQSLPEALALLRDTAFSFLEDIYNRTGDIKLAEFDLFNLEVLLYADINRHLSGAAAELSSTLSLRFEIDNLKDLTKEVSENELLMEYLKTKEEYVKLLVKIQQAVSETDELLMN